MLHGNMINIKSFTRPLLITAGALGLIVTVLTDIVSDSSDPGSLDSGSLDSRYAKVMQVLPEGDKKNAQLSDKRFIDALIDEVSPANTNEQQSGASVAVLDELIKPKMQVGFSEVEYALRLVKLDSFGQLVLNDKTESSLSRAVARLPADLPEHEITHILELIQTSLPGEAGAQVADVFTKYYRYKATEKVLVMNSIRPESIDTALEQLATMTELRYEIMGEEYAEKLFGAQQRSAEYHLEREIIRRDNALSVEERNQQLTHLKTTAQQSGLAMSSPSLEVQQLHTEVEKMRVQGQDETMIQMRREQTLGKGAAEQVSLMEQQQNDWQLRYQQFEQEKQVILAAVLDADDQQQQVNSLFLRHYSVEELPGARAYDQQFAH